MVWTRPEQDSLQKGAKGGTASQDAVVKEDVKALHPRGWSLSLENG